MVLSEIIAEEIKRNGPISFHDFMEMALYYPGLGYYTSNGEKIGTNGDYYTSADVTSAFGVMIGKQIEEMWKILGKKKFTIVEYGAGTGCLSHDILEYLKSNRKLYDELSYCIIEKSPVMREKEKMYLNDEKVKWYNSIKDIPEFCGCVLSNEVVDNFPVHQVVMEEELMEVFVNYENDFVELLQPAEQKLRDYVTELQVHLPKEFRTEINTEATEWISEVASFLKKGFVITIDYGYPSLELYKEYRRKGTLLCYHQHQINDDPYKYIGEQDITTHVNFSALHHWGLKNGLNSCGLTDQASFLLALGLEDHLKTIREQIHDDYAYYQKEIALTHTLLIDMGCKFKVLIQQKGLPEQKLSGLKFSPSLAKHIL
jgi:SAM-dependent MidA family methyltransferase